MKNKLTDIEKKQVKLKKTLWVVNKIAIILFAFFGALILLFNGFILISKAVSTSSKSKDFAFVADYYFVCVGTDGWAKSYPKNSLLIVHDVGVDYSYLMTGELETDSNEDRTLNLLRKDNVYLVKVEQDDEVSYAVAKVKNKVKEGVVLEGGMYVTYDQIIGVIEASIPAIAILQNMIFILIYLFLLVLYVAILIFFSYSDIGFDMLFEKEFRGQIRRDNTFAFDETKEKENIIKTDEEMVHDLIVKIISDSSGEGQDKRISVVNVKNALKVIEAKDFSSKEKMFVYLSALNLLNAYVKTDYCVEILKKKYFFKKNVQNICNYLYETHNADVKVFSEGTTALIECMGMQFSFHNVKINPGITNKEWGGIKLQPYANQIFELLFEQEFLGYNYPPESATLKKYLQLLNEVKVESNSNDENRD